MMTMQNDVTYFMGKCEAAECFGHIAEQPDEIHAFIRIDKAIGTLGVIGGMKGGNVEAKPLGDGIQRRLLVAPVWMCLAEMLEEKTGGLLGYESYMDVHYLTSLLLPWQLYKER